MTSSALAQRRVLRTICQRWICLVLATSAVFLLVNVADLPHLVLPPPRHSLLETHGHSGVQTRRGEARTNWTPGSRLQGTPEPPTLTPHMDATFSRNEAAVFSQLHKLLTTLEPWPSCPRLLAAGGRCIRCEVQSVAGYEDVVVGTTDGEKQVCLDMLPLNCTVLSFGISNDFSFDEAMEDLGCTVHAFDPTMGSSGFRHSSGIEFHGVGIGLQDDFDGNIPLATLATVLGRVGWQQGVIDYVKLDIESTEWGVLKQQLDSGGDLLRVRQLAVEYHLLQWEPILETMQHNTSAHNGDRLTAQLAQRFIEVLQTLRQLGFRLLYTKPYLTCKRYNGGCIPYVWETLYVNERFG